MNLNDLLTALKPSVLNRDDRQAMYPYMGMVPGPIGTGFQVAQNVEDQGLAKGLLSSAATMGTPALVRGLLGKAAGGVARSVIGYHGSPKKKPFDKFDLGAEKTTGGGMNSSGVSITPSEKVANRYATDFSQNGGWVYKVDADYKKPLNLSSRDFEKLQSLVGHARSGRPLSESQEIDIELLMKKAGIKYSGGNPIDAIKSAGYDAITKVPSNDFVEPETLVFNPDAIKILSRQFRQK